MKPLWRQMLENGVSKENIEKCIITKSSKGSPYEEVSEVSGEQEISFAVNPYIRMTKIVPGLETDDTFLLEIAKTITCIEYDTGMDEKRNRKWLFRTGHQRAMDKTDPDTAKRNIEESVSFLWTTSGDCFICI